MQFSLNSSEKIKQVIRQHRSSPQIALIKKLNPIIRGWSNYYATVVSKETFSTCDQITYNQLRSWAKRRHPNKYNQWVVSKYWHSYGNRNWVFSTEDEKKRFYQLQTHVETPIVRHVKVQGARSPFDGDLIYWSSRLGRHPELSNELATLLKRQKGKCAHCGLVFRDEDMLEIDHIIPISSGGDKFFYSNKQILHRHCHDVKTASDGSLTRIRDKEFIREKPDEVKVSSPVLKTSQRGDSLA